ncbi:MAG: aminotransferase class I/II-fold pyridoxal phosphate-dependent enzyme, partial [Gammaproteobacteria bacterium]
MKNIKQWINPAIRSMRAYQVPPPGDMIKMDAMENPYTWPASLKKEWHAVLDAVALNRYPDPEAARLKEKLRAVMAISAGTDMILGNGSDELIQVLDIALGGPGRTCLAPEPGFVMYRQSAQALNMEFHGVPLALPDFSLDQAAMLAAMEKYQPALVFIGFPNNPTG